MNNINKNERVIENEPANFMRRYIYSRENQFFTNYFAKEKKIDYKNKILGDYIEGFRIYSDQTLLQLYISKYNFEKFYNLPYFRTAEVDALIEKYIDIDEFYLCINAYVLKLQLNFELKLFYKFYDLVFDNMSLLGIYERPFLINAVLNLISEQIRLKTKGFVELEFETYKYLDKNDLFTINPNLGYRIINNVVKSYMLFDYKDEASIFLNKHIKKLHPNIKDSCYHYNKANINFFKGDFENIIPELNKINIEDSIVYRINIKKLELITALMLQNYEIAKYQINSFRKYLDDFKSLSKENKSDIVFFLKVSKKLCKPLTSKDRVIIKTYVENHDINDTQIIHWFSVILNTKK